MSTVAAWLHSASRGIAFLSVIDRPIPKLFLTHANKRTREGATIHPRRIEMRSSRTGAKMPEERLQSAVSVSDRKERSRTLAFAPLHGTPFPVSRDVIWSYVGRAPGRPGARLALYFRFESSESARPSAPCSPLYPPNDPEGRARLGFRGAQCTASLGALNSRNCVESVVAKC